MVHIVKGVEKMKVLIFDSGALINLSMNGLLYILESLKAKFNGKFIITKQVKYETIDRPIGIQRFELGALMVQALLDSKVIELPSSLNVSVEEIDKRTKELVEAANHYIEWQKTPIKIVSDAEISCIALSKILNEKNIENIIAIDERTTRLLSENPKGLEKLMSEKLHKRVEIASSNSNLFKGHKFIRSSEIVYVAYKKNLLNLKGKKALEAVLFATKFKGSAISFEEISSLLKQEKSTG